VNQDEGRKTKDERRRKTFVFRPSSFVRGLGIRARLGLLYAALLALTLLASDLLLYFLLAGTLGQQVDQALVDQARAIAGTSEVRGPDRFGFNQATVVLPDLDVFTSPATFVQVVDGEGQIAARSATLGRRELPRDAAILAPAMAGRRTVETRVVDGVPLRLFQAPLEVGDRVVGVLQVARSLTDVEASLGRLRLALAAVGVIGLGLAGAAGWALAGVALRPIDRVTKSAAAIGAARDFARRLPPPDTADEVGRLVTTFNTMLDALEAAHAELTKALEAHRRFVADASHELRTPLATIRTNLELLGRVEDLAPADREEALADARAEVERLGRLVADLLTLARADAGVHLARRPVALAALVRDVYRQARLLALPRAQRVILEENEPATVAGDPDALRQLLLILLDNALKYSPDGAEVRLALRRDGDTARLSVSDDGPGIPPEDLPEIFHRFYRADPARTSAGAGLGLAIAHWIATEHAAQISVTSAPGHGTTFSVELRVTNDEQTSSPSSSDMSPGASPVSP
jgi:signal transduction histidine kinase